uniref:Guanylate cyclase domain-containing protein n=1 Tax=Chromera velia CCMP2878 TaxID=1169474 RepID=A0A0G4F3H4_9ALVE|eukprot:Cvel_14802.t1-p1 / transcript=Cvel_14802.t1 / gene=Cvel_14802 / organism=Chromera_velia_CCMP2878 / gene_product=hypothetical protein / transcript_product=hypothetical protein / location=Cvel_scaffold1068:3823-10150(-) / protein_length=1086 / sequence_SO=supercontig / SO=protein_coding / is_pseudo=false
MAARDNSTAPKGASRVSRLQDDEKQEHQWTWVGSQTEEAQEAKERGMTVEQYRKEKERLSQIEKDGSDDEDKVTLRDKTEAFMNHGVVFGTMMIVTCFALYGDDIRLFFFNKNADQTFFALFFISFVLFAAELTVNCIIMEGYKAGFFFYLDIVATVSLIPDIEWIMTPLLTALGQSGSGGGLGNATAARAGRASRAGTRAGRIVRLVRLVRLIRVADLAQWLCPRELTEEEQEEKRKAEEQAKVNAQKGEEAAKRIEASRLGKILSEQTTRRVILGVLTVLFVIPNLQYSEVDLSAEYGLEQLTLYGASRCNAKDYANFPSFGCSMYDPPLTDVGWVTDEGWKYMLWLYSTSSLDPATALTMTSVSSTDVPRRLLWLQIPDFLNNGTMTNISSVSSSAGDWEAEGRCAGFRTEFACPWRESEMEVVAFTPSQCAKTERACQQLVSGAKFLNLDNSRLSAGLSMLTTTFIVFLLGLGSLMFSRDTQTLVIAPIEKMVGRSVGIVKQLADDPLAKPELNDEDFDDFLQEGGGKPKSDSSGQLETAMLENTILKIGGLLQVGFGQAGASVIGENMSSQSGKLDLMAHGRKVYAVYAFVEINHFAEVTECLLEEVMVFVNKIARIVHSCVHSWNGAANKNMGSTFLLVWLLHDKECFKEFRKNRRASRLDEEELRRLQTQEKNADTPGQKRRGRQGTQQRTSMTKETAAALASPAAQEALRRKSSVGTQQGGGGSAAGGQSNSKEGQNLSVPPSPNVGRAFDSLSEIGVPPSDRKDSVQARRSSFMVATAEQTEAVKAAEAQNHPLREGLGGKNDLGSVEPSDTEGMPPEFFQKKEELLRRRNETSDFALIALVKTMMEVQRAGDLQTYSRHPKIFPRFPSSYTVQVRAGLHCGWAIEGAIGSEFKIEASYLSLHVNTAARLQTATKLYGVQLLFSEQFFEYLAPSAQERSRRIDNVVLKGLHKPIGIYTFDMTPTPPPVAEGHTIGILRPPEDVTVEVLMAQGTDAIFRLDLDFVFLREFFSFDFSSNWTLGFRAFVNGDWDAAQLSFQRCLDEIPDDGPSEVMLQFIADNDHTPPVSWAGFKILTAK